MKVSGVVFAASLCFSAFGFGGIAGTYKIKGYDPQSGNYTGRAVISERDSVYTGTFTYSGGGVSTLTGVRKGDEVSFVYQFNDGLYGVQVYRISGHTLKGPWVEFGGGNKGWERLTKIRHHQQPVA
jgi:hypothetical protein